MVRVSWSRAHGDVSDTKRRVTTALDRYGAFASAVKRADVSAQTSGVKVLENLASIAAQDQLLLRNSADLRRFFAAAVGKVDLAVLLRSPAAAVQLAALRASNTLSQHVETLPSASLPCVVKLLQSSDGTSELAVSTLRHLIRPFGPSIVWQTIHDGKGSEMLLAKVEAWAQGSSSAAAHLRLLSYLLQSSLAAQRQLLEDATLADRWANALLQLLQQALSGSDTEVVTAAVHAVSSMEPFIQHVQTDAAKYTMLETATATALQAGNRLQWREAGSPTALTNTACNLLDTLACITPPHVQTADTAHRSGVATSLAKALQTLLSEQRGSLQASSPGHRVLSAALKAVCVLLLPPHFTHGSGLKSSPWVIALGPNVPARLIALISKDGLDHAVDTWCWQALYLLQGQLSPGQLDQILKHPVAQRIPSTSILTLDPLYCSYSALRVILACKSATKHAPAFRHMSQSSSGAHMQGQASMGSSALWSQADRQQWPQGDSQVQRHHLLLPKALPQGNLMRYFDLACITAGLRCLSGQQDAWEDAWLVLKHALANLGKEDGYAWTSAVIASLQALTEAGAAGCLPPETCRELLCLADCASKGSPGSTAVPSLPVELAYGDVKAGNGSKGALVPPPLQQRENAQLKLWWAVAAAACCGQLGLPSELGETLRGLLEDDSLVDVAFGLQNPQDTVWAHAAIVAAGCPKLYQDVLRQRQQQHQQQQQQQQLAYRHSSSNGSVRLQLGKQVRADTFLQAVEYLYTGQVLTLTSSEDRAALQKLAHALELPQLAMLAAGSRPTPGAVYTPMSLCCIATGRPTSVPWAPSMSEAECQQLMEQQKQHQQQAGLVAHVDQLTAATAATQVATAATKVATAATQVANQLEEPDEHGVNQILHPNVHQLFGPSLEAQLPAKLPMPTEMPPHMDLFLVPRQTCQCCCPAVSHSDAPLHLLMCSKPSEYKQGSDMCVEDAAAGRGLGPATRSGQMHKESGSVAANSQGFLQGLCAHRCILAASSPYFAAMLSDRWQAYTEADAASHFEEQQHDSRHLLVAKLPTHDMDVLHAFLHFCYARELQLRPQGQLCSGSLHTACRICWQARTAVRLSAAAEAWMVPALQDLCWQYLADIVQSLPLGCQSVVTGDITELQLGSLSATELYHM